ncbi:MAG: Fur family transcriptional regulator [Myxococcota bacterium]
MTDSASDSALRAQLRTAGLRATRSRVTVLRVLQDASAPTSHPELTEQLANDGWDRATLYRNLVDMTDAGLLNRVDLGDHVWRFELAGRPHDSNDHPHFLCTSCGDVSCLPDLALPKGAAGLPRSVVDGQVSIQLRGLCDECATP